MNERFKFRTAKLHVYLRLIASRVVRARVAAEDIALLEPAEPRFDAPPDDGPWQPTNLGEPWGAKQRWAYFKGRLQVPSDWPKNGIALSFQNEARFLESPQDDNFAAGPEGQVFIDGVRAGAIDGGHQRVRWAFEPGRSHDVRAVFFAARCACRHVLADFAVVHVDRATEKLYYDLRVALEMIDALDEATPAREKLIRAVESALAALDARELVGNVPVPQELRRDPADELFYASVPAAQAAFDKAAGQLADAGEHPGVWCTGHAHIDLAWLWPISQSKHKCVRTFATQIRLMDQYRDFVFLQSSPQAYKWIEQEAPELFEGIRQRVMSGQWEADGATWVEMDTNTVSGESLVRQLLYGQRYFREKFGAAGKFLYLPDVFGYSAALPQLLRLAGVTGFVTQKISWNQYNRFPFQTFRWRGIDGTEIPSHFPLNTYNGLTSGQPVREIKDQWDRYLDKPLLNEPLLPFGWGDGGGGPTEEMLEVLDRLNHGPAAAGVPRARIGKVGELVDRIAARADELPVWDGELYLEYHRGTYTTQAWLKRANRKNEIRLHNVEWLAVLAERAGFALDKAKLDEIWQDLLLMQFHDILPGSSVGEVYDEVRPMQARISHEADAMIDVACDAMCRTIDTSSCKDPVALFNTLAWDRTDPIRLPDGTWRDDITVPAGGWAVVDAADAPQASASSDLTISDDARTLANRYWRITLNKTGQISELHDLANDRAVLPAGASANAWQVFEDRPMNFDAWDIDLYYQEHPLAGPACTSIEVVERGPVRVAVELTWQMPQIGDGPVSTITQRIALYANHPRIDFETHVDWHEHHQLLKVAFPVDVRATDATYEIQFGHVRRPTHANTSWDMARFECCGHKFVDLGEHGYGVALLNDCKYGHDIRDNVIRLTCIKSPQAPDARADQGEHAFTYALLPHAGSFQEAGVVRTAAEFNVPVLTRATKPGAGDIPASGRLICTDNPAIVIDTLKLAEDGNGAIIRLFESHGSHARAQLTFARPPASIETVNLLEEPLPDAPAVSLSNGDAEVSLRPFEVLTLRMRF